jgi:hypothetical protein
MDCGGCVVCVPRRRGRWRAPETCISGTRPSLLGSLFLRGVGTFDRGFNRTRKWVAPCFPSSPLARLVGVIYCDRVASSVVLAVSAKILDWTRSDFGGKPCHLSPSPMQQADNVHLLLSLIPIFRLPTTDFSSTSVNGGGLGWKNGHAVQRRRQGAGSRGPYAQNLLQIFIIFIIISKICYKFSNFFYFLSF